MASRTLHTERLDLIPWRREHATRLDELAQHADLAEMITRSEPWTPSTARTISDRMRHHWEAYGFGWRAMSERSVEVVTGFVGVSYTGRNEAGLDPSEHEFGCWVHPSYWRRGLAIEASAAVIEQAFEELAAPSVVGYARADHRASIDGATALGFTVLRRTLIEPGFEAVVLRVTADEWSRRARSLHV